MRIPPPSVRAPALALVLALASGALLVTTFAPFGWFPLGALALAGFWQALENATPRAGFWRGFAFGLGLLGGGVFWIRISLNEFGNLPPPLAWLLTALFIAAMALYYGLLGWLARRALAWTWRWPAPKVSTGPGAASGAETATGADIGMRAAIGTGAAPGDARRPEWIGPLLLFPGLYVLLEWLRGWLFTGFPWLSLGYGQIDGPLAGYAPLLGVHGLSLLTVLGGGLLWGLWRWRGVWRLRAGLALLAILLTGPALGPIDWTRPAGPAFRAAAVQASIPQALKWEPEARLSTMETYWELTEAHLDARLVVWPETAVPDFLHQVRDILIDPMARRARAEGTAIVLGIPVLDRETDRYYNSLISLGAGEDRYDKRHLVPFGEFLPFKDWLGPLVELFAIPMSDFSAGTAERPLLRVGDYRAGVSICYEDAFAAEVRQALPEAAFLINVSNDAWFGDSLAPHQHLEMARMRALENGRDLVRATNTGISAIVDARGRILAEIPAFVRGGAAAEVQPRQGLTPFARFGNALAIGLALALLAAGLAFRARVIEGKKPDRAG